MKIRVICIVFFLQSMLFGQIRYLETKNMFLIYPSQAQEYLVPYTAQCFENALQFHRKLFAYPSSEKTTVFLQDFWDYGNAGATAIPDNYIRIGIAPLNYTFETSPANERINHTMNHELVHVIASDKASGSDKFFRKLFFGKVYVAADDPLSMYYSYLTNPRRYAPRWYHEGIAVFLETWMAGGIGRALGSYDEMVFRTMVRDSVYIYDVVGLESEGTTADFQVGVNSYLYGTRFMSYLAYQYSPEKLTDWISSTKNRKNYFASDFKNTFGSALDEQWSAWIKWEKNFQKENLASLRQYPATKYRKISKTALGSVSRAYFDKKKNKIYAAIMYPGQTAHIAAIDVNSGSVKKLVDVHGPGLFYVTSLAYNPATETLFYTTDNSSWRDLYSLDLKSLKTTRLIKDVRTGDLAFNAQDNSIWGVRHYNGISTLVRIPFPYKKWQQIYSFPYGKDIYDIDISPDGQTISAALAEISGRQLLIKMETAKLLDDQTSYETIFDFENSLPANFTFSDDGNYLFGSSYYSGVSNIYRYNLETKNIVALSNSETGFFRPIPLSSDSLIVFRYSGQGFTPLMIANDSVQNVSAVNFLGNEIVKKHPVVKNWNAGSPAAINMDSVTVSSGFYAPLSNIGLKSIYPIIEGYKDFASLGLRFDFLDRLGIVGIKTKISYSPHNLLEEDERLHALLNVHYWNWEAHAAYNKADFYDLFGPTKTSRKGNVLGLKYKVSLLDEKPQAIDLTVNFNSYSNLDRLPFFQNVNTSIDRFLTFGANLAHSNLQKTLGSIDFEKGWDYEIVSYNYYANKELFPHILFNFNYGYLLPLKHSSLWLRSSFGASQGKRSIAFSNFYFGGFGNNWIDHQDVQRYHEYYSFPGVKLNSIQGQNFAKITTEWTLPPIRFRRAGTPGMYLNWSRISLFSSGIISDINNSTYQNKVANLGLQVDFKMVIFTYMSATFSLGYATALKENLPIKKATNEFMISLKIL